MQLSLFFNRAPSLYRKGSPPFLLEARRNVWFFECAAYRDGVIVSERSVGIVYWTPRPSPAETIPRLLQSQKNAFRAFHKVALSIAPPRRL